MRTADILNNVQINTRKKKKKNAQKTRYVLFVQSIINNNGKKKKIKKIVRAERKSCMINRIRKVDARFP